MTLEDILHEDRVAIPVWGTFTLASIARPIMGVLSGEIHGTIQTFISILPALCGAYMGYRFMVINDRYRAAKLLADQEKMHAEHALERERIAASREYRELPILQAVKEADPHEDTVELP